MDKLAGRRPEVPGRIAVLLAATLLVAAACQAGPGATPTAAPPTGQDTPPAGTPGEATPGQETPPPDGEPGVVIPEQAQQQIDQLRSTLEGQSYIIGTSAFPNSSIVGAFKTVELMEEIFGVDIDFRELDSDPLVAAMLSGQVQVGQLSLAGQASANEAGGDFVAIGADDQKNTFLVAAKDPIESLEEVEGQPFGVTQNLNQITGQTARKCLEAVGLDVERDVQLLRLGNTGEITQAIRADQLVAGISAIFRLTQMRLEDGDIYNVLCEGWEVNPQISSIWMVTRDFAAQNEDFLVALNVASLLSARWANDNPQDWVQTATGYVEGLTPEAAEIDYQNLVVELDNWPVNGSLDREMCQQTLDTSFEFGVITQELQCEDVVTFEYQDRAVELLGEQ